MALLFTENHTRAGRLNFSTNVRARFAMITSINASSVLNPGALTAVSDTNVVLTAGGSASAALLAAASITASWTGTLAASRLNGNVVQSVVNDTNVTGSIAAQALTLGWTGTLALSRLAQGTDGQLVVGQTSAASQYKTIAGDWTMSAAGAATLATVNSNVGTFGSATQASQVTVNGKGLVTAAANVTVTPAVGSITGLGTGVATFLATPSSANLAAALTDETGSGAAVFGTSPTISAPTISGTTNLTGGQIAFPATQSASAGANTLDDYEEGTFTPVLRFGGGSTGITYTAQIGHYQKVGNRCTIQISILLSSKGSSVGGADLSGLPFTSANTTNYFSVWAIYANTVTQSTHVQCGANPNDTIVFLQYLTGGGTANFTNTDFANTTTLFIAGAYETTG